jgi:hypothetical protein
LFVLTLGYSRKAVRLPTFRSSSRIWAELHEKAFRRLGGSTHVVVLDNLREGVLVPDIYDPTLNPLYRDVLAHYGVIALPCRIKDPDRKGKVESAVGHTQKTPLKGKRFESLEEAQTYLDHWETSCADTRIHGTTKRFRDAFPPDFEVAAYRVSCLGNSYGTASLAMPSDAARELVRGQGGSRTLSGRVPASLFGQADLSQHFSDSTNNRGRIGVCSESHLLRATDVECSTPMNLRASRLCAATGPIRAA